MEIDRRQIALIEIDILESIEKKARKGKLDEAFYQKYSDVCDELDGYMRW